MALDVEEVRRIAHLARLHLSPEEEELFVGQLRQIIEYFDQLKEFEVLDDADEGGGTMEVEDVPGSSMPRQRFLENAPDRLDAFLLVPQVKVTGDE